MKKNNNKNTPSDHPEESRRRFLKAAGKLAVYTPPAMMLLMKPSYAHFNKSGGRIDGHDRYRNFDWDTFIRRLLEYLGYYD